LADKNSGKDAKRLIHRILVVVPANTLVNWQNEFIKWINQLQMPKIRINVLNDVTGTAAYRDSIIKDKWFNRGGILLSSDKKLLRFLKPVMSDKKVSTPRYEAFFSPGPCVVVVDEAHLFLKSSRTEMSKLLEMIETKRRIALTGTPLQNNLMEYYRMANWVKADCLGPPKEFERMYAGPIMKSMLVSFPTISPYYASMEFPLTTLCNITYPRLIHQGLR
jgi:transcriptional regulator ATRX